MKLEKIVWVGFGAVAFGCMEIINKEGLFRDVEMIVIEPLDISKKQFKQGKFPPKKSVLDDFKGAHKVKFIQEAITKDNCERLLDFCGCNEKTLIANLSVDVDSIMIMLYAKKNGCLYIDTSLENYPGDDELRSKLGMTWNDVKMESLLFRGYEAEKLIREAERKTSTIVGSFGFNPGLVNNYAKRGLKFYAKKKNSELLKKMVWKGDYRALSKSLGLKEILVVEYDSQKTQLKASNDVFINTWSAVGFQMEASDNVMLSLNEADKKKFGKDELITPTGDCRKFAPSVYFLKERGMNAYGKAWTLDKDGIPFEYEGRLIPHQEIVSMSSFFGGKHHPISIAYIYSSSEISQKSLEHFKQANYHLLKNNYVMCADDIDSGFDSIGALLRFENGDEVWCGSVCDLKDVKLMNLISGPTIIQVAGAVVANMLFMIDDPQLGLLFPEEIPHKRIFKFASKYEGREFCRLYEASS